MVPFGRGFESSLPFGRGSGGRIEVGSENHFSKWKSRSSRLDWIVTFSAVSVLYFLGMNCSEMSIILLSGMSLYIGRLPTTLSLVILTRNSPAGTWAE